MSAPAPSPVSEAPSPDAPEARPAEAIWCIICRSFRPFRSVPVAATSRHFARGFDTDRLVCAGCSTDLVIVRAKTEDQIP